MYVSYVRCKTHVGDTQRGKIISLILATSHPISLSASASRASHVRRHVRSLAGAQAARAAIIHTRRAGSDVAGALLAHGGDGALEGTSGCEMLAVTDTALDLLVLQLVLHASGVGLLLLGVLAPVRAGSEYDVLANGGGI